ncbi:MAG TPA: EF-P lysine aminoacylase EpmA [Thermoanaerobaculia bacterium]|nr:EF-P lysine aminoacylase EpmA [Thermoanaerobaculia bacterium]
MTADAAGGGTGADDWRPTAGFDALRRRADLLARLRGFFAERGVLEVETPLLGAAGTPETHLESLEVHRPRLFLQTSPEFHMKRLLAAGSGPIWQLARVARGGERGRRHNLEFSLLEWYRPGWDHHRLMDEVAELVGHLLERAIEAERLTYGELFSRHLGLDPHRASLADLDRAAAPHAPPPFDSDDRDGRLAFLLTHAVEPELAAGALFVHDYPASQASLARVRPAAGDEPAVAERFELYLDGVELANGFNELTDAGEQRRRFEADRAERRRRGLPDVPLDERLLAALEAGLPPCAGVALGFDRLVMQATGASSIDDVIAFPTERA